MYITYEQLNRDVLYILEDCTDKRLCKALEHTLEARKKLSVMESAIEQYIGSGLGEEGYKDLLIAYNEFRKGRAFDE